MDDRQIERLKWRCRRGLLELDLLFERLWQSDWQTLSGEELQSLDRLLQLPDNDILDMIMARQHCDTAVAPIVRRLRQA